MDLINELNEDYVAGLGYGKPVHKCPHCKSVPSVFLESAEDGGDYKVFCDECGKGREEVDFHEEKRDCIDSWNEFVVGEVEHYCDVAAEGICCPFCGNDFNLTLSAEENDSSDGFEFRFECHSCEYEEGPFGSASDVKPHLKALRKRLEAQFGEDVMKGMMAWFKETFKKSEKEEELNASDKARLVAEAIAGAKSNEGKVVLPAGHMVVPVAAVRTPAEIERLAKLKASLEGTKDDPVLGQYSKYLLCLLG